MAAAVATYNGDLLVYESRRRGIQPLGIGLDDRKHELRSRIKALAGLWEALNRPIDTQCFQNGQEAAARDLRQPSTVAHPLAVPPPSYEDSLCDLPPDYTFTDAFATAQTIADQSGLPKPSIGSEKLDLSALEGIRSYAKKKDKKAAKQAATSKWAGDGDEEEKKEEGAEGGEDGNAGGGDDGAGAGGDGGDPPGGGGGDGGGDDGDDWNAGASKKGKKKKKKNAWEEFEDEEVAAKKADEEAAAVVDVPVTAVAADAPPEDDFGFSTGKKGKKGKKGKVSEPEPEPEPEVVVVPEPAMDTVDLGASVTVDGAGEGNAEDEWGGFSTGKKKKGKKGKVRVCCSRIVVLSRFIGTHGELPAMESAHATGQDTSALGMQQLGCNAPVYAFYETFEPRALLQPSYAIRQPVPAPSCEATPPHLAVAFPTACLLVSETAIGSLTWPGTHLSQAAGGIVAVLERWDLLRLNVLASCVGSCHITQRPPFPA